MPSGTEPENQGLLTVCHWSIDNYVTELDDGAMGQLGPFKGLCPKVSAGPHTSWQAANFVLTALQKRID